MCVDKKLLLSNHILYILELDPGDFLALYHTYDDVIYGLGIFAGLLWLNVDPVLSGGIRSEVMTVNTFIVLVTLLDRPGRDRSTF